MVEIANPSAEERALWAEWVATRPDNVRAVAERFNPWSLYRLKSTGQRVTIYSFGEEDDGSVSMSVIVSAAFNLLCMERRVFGISPDDLEDAELPADGELVGEFMSDAEQTDLINQKRAENGLPPIA